MLVQRHMTTGHGAYEIRLRNIGDLSALDLLAIAQNRIVVADGKNLIHLVADEDNRVVAIEEAAQMSVSEIFERFGEDYFRDGERRVIARLLYSGPAVIATGGGAFAQEETRKLVLERGIAVWLDADANTIVDRVRRKDTRPLLKDGDPREIVSRLKAEREPLYAEAPIHVSSSSGPHGDTVIRIIAELDRWL